MVLRSGVRRILMLPRLPRHVASKGLLPWINHYRLAGSAVSSSINRAVSTNAKKLDMATVMVQPDTKNPLETFREHFKKGTLTRPLVVSCLEDAVRFNQPGSQMGEAAIMWLWRSHDSIEYPDDTDIVSSIAILLVREGKEELMWNWMSQESRKPTSKLRKHKHFDRRFPWRSAALRGLVEAKARLDTNNSLDAALETYFRGTKVPYHIDTEAAANFCHKMLTNIRVDLGSRRSYDEMRNGLAFANTDPGLWDAFYTEMGKFGGQLGEIFRADMKLHHTQHPDPRPSLDFWRQAEHNQNHTLRHVKTRSGAIARVESSRDLRLVLKHQGYDEEAAWVKQFVEELFPRDRNSRGSHAGNG